MAKFNIVKDSVKLLGGVKTGMNVTFKTEDGARSVTQYHEVESTDQATIEKELQKTADEFESRVPSNKTVPIMETGKDIKFAAVENEEFVVDFK